ncbi:hypothetical protein IAD21_00240 [Abditibacteriota bacterium]|nr:hypothetical protein IAD21_00240 [Abditibacteriota bacterium]
MNTSEIRELAELLRQLKKTDKRFRVFGSDSHTYQLGPKLSEVELAEFEQTHRVRLPEDYRLFLHEVGNGGPGPYRAGAGPYYGLEPLQDAVEECDLSQPFPLVKAQAYSPEGGIENEVEVSNERDEYFGLLKLSEQGCGMAWYLVVNGPTYGLVWDGLGIAFEPTGLTFSQWYRRWVEKALRVLGNEPLIERISIGMTKEQVIEATGGNRKERKNEFSENYYFEAPEIPAQIILNGENRVVEDIKPWLFI